MILPLGWLFGPNFGLAALVLAFTWLGIGVCSTSRTKPELAKFQVSKLEQTIELYRLDTGSLPSAEKGLQALLEPNARAPKGYIMRGDLRDPWGQTFVYRVPAVRSGWEYEIYSKGANGLDEAGSDDDITAVSDLLWLSFE